MLMSLLFTQEVRMKSGFKTPFLIFGILCGLRMGTIMLPDHQANELCYVQQWLKLLLTHLLAEKSASKSASIKSPTQMSLGKATPRQAAVAWPAAAKFHQQCLSSMQRCDAKCVLKNATDSPRYVGTFSVQGKFALWGRTLPPSWLQQQLPSQYLTFCVTARAHTSC